MKTTYIFIVLIIFSGLSCTPIMKQIYGIKNPKPTSDSVIIDKSEKFFSQKYILYRPVNGIMFRKLTKDFGIGFPDILFFNAQNMQVNISADTLKKCTAKADYFIRQLNELNYLKPLKVSKDDLNLCIKSLNNTGNDLSNTNPECSLYIFWSDFIGKKLNRQGPLTWINLYNQLPIATKKKIDLKIINMDLLEDMK